MNRDFLMPRRSVNFITTILHVWIIHCLAIFINPLTINRIVMPRRDPGGHHASGLSFGSSLSRFDGPSSSPLLSSFVFDPFIDLDHDGRTSVVDPLMCRCILDGWRHVKLDVHAYNANRTDELINMWNREVLVEAR